jgi:hypothetical protein
LFFLLFFVYGKGENKWKKGIRYIRQAETLEGMGEKIRDAENISRQECCTAQQQQMLNKKGED